VGIDEAPCDGDIQSFVEPCFLFGRFFETVGNQLGPGLDYGNQFWALCFEVIRVSVNEQYPQFIRDQNLIIENFIELRGNFRLVFGKSQFVRELDHSEKREKYGLKMNQSTVRLFDFLLRCRGVFELGMWLTQSSHIIDQQLKCR